MIEFKDETGTNEDCILIGGGLNVDEETINFSNGNWS